MKVKHICFKEIWRFCGNWERERKTCFFINTHITTNSTIASEFHGFFSFVALPLFMACRLILRSHNFQFSSIFVYIHIWLCVVCLSSVCLLFCNFSLDLFLYRMFYKNVHSHACVAESTLEKKQTITTTLIPVEGESERKRGQKAAKLNKTGNRREKKQKR